MYCTKRIPERLGNFQDCSIWLNGKFSIFNIDLFVIIFNITNKSFKFAILNIFYSSVYSIIIFQVLTALFTLLANLRDRIMQSTAYKMQHLNFDARKEQ